MAGLAGGAEPALHLARGLAAAAAFAGVGQSHRPQNTRAGAVAVCAWHHAALHACGRQLAQHDGIHPARAQAPRARRAASAQPCGDRQLVRADGTLLECTADAICLERQAPAAATALVTGPAPPDRWLRSLHPPAASSAQITGASRMPGSMEDDPLVPCPKPDISWTSLDNLQPLSIHVSLK